MLPQIGSGGWGKGNDSIWLSQGERERVVGFETPSLSFQARLSDDDLLY